MKLKLRRLHRDHSITAKELRAAIAWTNYLCDRKERIIADCLKTMDELRELGVQPREMPKTSNRWIGEFIKRHQTDNPATKENP